MNSKTLTFSASEQDLQNSSEVLVIASDTVSYIEATFTLGTNWSGFDYTRAVWRNGKVTVATTLDNNASCVVPAEVLVNEGKVTVNLVGSDFEDEELVDRLTTFPVVAIHVAQKVKIDGTAVPITPSEVERIIAAVEDDAEAAEEAATSAEADALKAEGFAVGKQDGTAVGSDSPYYHNNAEYYKDQTHTDATAAAADALIAEGNAVGKQNGTDVASGSPYYHNNAKYYSDQASGSASSADTDAAAAAADALKSEGHAVGQQNGSDVASGSPYYHNNAKYFKDEADADATSAAADALKSEGHAVGQQNGTDVTSGSGYYHNNAKYYKEQADTDAQTASAKALESEGYAVGKQNGSDVGSGSDYYHNNAKYYKEEAAGSASNAASDKTAADGFAKDSEAYAVGKRGGVDVGSSDPTYHNNAKYYADQAEEAAEIAVEAAETVNAVYGVKWDRTTNQLTRLAGARDITTDITNFKHSGSFNSSLNNPFDLRYPWSDIKVCDVDLTAYRARQGTEPLSSFITAIYGDPDFTYEGSQTNFVGQYVPEFWYRSEEDASGAVSYYISTVARIGYKHHEESFNGISFAIDAGLNANNQHVITCGTGLPYTDVAGSTLHQYAKNSGFTLMDIDEVDAITCLFLVEFANWNSQAALGDGCSSCYRENAADVLANVDHTGTTTVFEINDSALSSVIFNGSQVDFGATQGARTYKAVVKSFSLSGTTYTITLDRLLTSLTDGMFMSVHGFDACEFPLINASVGNGSGYIGTNGKANAWYRGAVLFANRYQYILGMYRQQTTNHLWICPEGVDPDDYDALNTSVHQDTGIALPTLESGAWQTVGGNAQRIPGLAAFMATGASSGSSSSPVGDQQYVPTPSTGNTVLWLGCGAAGGWSCGVVGCPWDSGAGLSYWACAARPLLKKSL